MTDNPFLQWLAIFGILIGALIGSLVAVLVGLHVHYKWTRRKRRR